MCLLIKKINLTDHNTSLILRNIFIKIQIITIWSMNHILRTTWQVSTHSMDIQSQNDVCEHKETSLLDDYKYTHAIVVLAKNMKVIRKGCSFVTGFLHPLIMICFPYLDSIRVSPHHKFTLVFRCLMMEVWSEKLCSRRNLDLFLNAVPLLYIVVHLFSLLKEKVLIVLKVRDTSKLGILCDNWSIFHICFPFWHIEFRDNRMIPRVFRNPRSTVCKQISPKIVSDGDGSLLVRHL